MRRARPLLLSLAALVALGAVWLWVLVPLAARSGVPILTYHYFSSPEHPRPPIPYGVADYYVVTRTEFEHQLDYLEAHGYHTLTFADLCRLRRHQNLPPKPIVITVDHEGIDRLQIAVPALLRHHMCATFFVVTSWIGQPGNVTAADLRAMADQGMEIASHTRTHPTMNRVTRARQATELRDSRRELEAMIGRPVLTMSPPGGEWDGVTVEEARKAGYLGFRTTDPGFGHLGDYVWPGITVPGGLARDEFARMTEPGNVATYLAMRRIEAFARRAMGATTYHEMRSLLLASGLGHVIQSPVASAAVRKFLALFLALVAVSWLGVLVLPERGRWRAWARAARGWVLLMVAVTGLRLATFEMLRPTWNITDPHRLAVSPEDDDDIARNLLDGRGFSRVPGEAVPTVSTGPVWPVLLAGVFRLRADLQGTVLLLSLLSAIAAVFMVRIGRRLWSASVGWVAAAVYAACPHLLLVSVLLVGANLLVVLVTAAIDGVLVLRERPRPLTGAWLGLLGGLLTLTGSIYLLCVPVLLGLGVSGVGPGLRRAYLRASGLALAVIIVMVLPWTARNTVVSGAPVPVQVWAGRQYWQGEVWANADWNISRGRRDTLELGELTRQLGHPELGPRLGARQEVAEDRALVAAAWSQLHTEPRHLLYKGLTNAAHFWYRAAGAAETRVLLLFQLPLLLLSAVGLAALALRRRFTRQVLLVIAPAILLMLLRAPFLARGRHCVPVEPAIILPAAWALVAGPRALARRLFRPPAGPPPSPPR
ncbi:MAG TPA: polysaccharide deacetylase family protein [Candidatus Saccharimonadales bacterium]|nr:polysaccharide deacetylase family protein [Candidatus Saccharimonadales bacterium]